MLRSTQAHKWNRPPHVYVSLNLSYSLDRVGPQCVIQRHGRHAVRVRRSVQQHPLCEYAGRCVINRSAASNSLRHHTQAAALSSPSISVAAAAATLVLCTQLLLHCAANILFYFYNGAHPCS